MASPVEITRDLRLDLFRGLALWLIFLAHIPGNIVNRFVPFHYGFSDAAEMFIFVSGYANAYVYGRLMRQSGFVASAAHILNRAFHLYVAQIFLFVVFVGEIAFLSHGTHVFDDAMNVRIFHEQPDAATLAVLQLKFMPVNMDVLPVYIVLLIGCPPMLWLLWRMPMLAFAASAALYLLANIIDLNLPAFPRGFWYFNPLAWQFLFVIGAWCGLGAADWLWSFIRSRAVLGIAAAYVLFGLFVVIAWHTPRLAPYVPDWFAHPLGKTNLGVMRLAHFLAIAVLVDRFVPQDWPPLTSRILRPVINCGQHSLEVFCFGVILAFAGYVTVVGGPDGAMSQLLVPAFGIAAMIGLGALVSWYGTIKISFRATAAVGVAAHPASGAEVRTVGSRPGSLSAVPDATPRPQRPASPVTLTNPPEARGA
jgi:hypothetical protein